VDPPAAVADADDADVAPVGATVAAEADAAVVALPAAGESSPQATSAQHKIDRAANDSRYGRM